MTLTLYDQDFDSELLTKVTEAVNSDSERITMYICSDGGWVCVCQVLLNIINKNKDRFKLIGFENLYSSAFEFFVKAECEKELLPYTLGMIHQPTRTMSLNNNLKPFNEGNIASHERVKKYTIPKDEIFIKRLGLTPKELREYKKGNDVYFQYDRFLEVAGNYKTNLK
jgi:hypothetical protein